MQLRAFAANSLWNLSNWPAYWTFARALRDPQASQTRKLQVYLRRNAKTAFGKAHGFDRIQSYEEFVNEDGPLLARVTPHQGEHEHKANRKDGRRL